jgi:hypothetical protein
MSTITNASFIGGEDLTAATVNAKFQDITTATTTALDEANIRNQSIDMSQMDGTALSGKSDIILVSMKQGSVGSGSDLTTLVAYPTSRTGIPLSSGGAPTNLAWGAVLSTNDMLRVYWSGRCTPFTNASAGNTALTNDMCWVFFLQWDITSAGLTNWVEVPNQGGWSTEIESAGSGKYGEPTDTIIPSIGNNRGIQGSAIVPHYQAWIDSSGGLQRIVPKRNNINGSYYYKNAGADVTVYGLRLKVGGPYKGHTNHETGSATDRNYLKYNTANVGAGDTVTVYNAQIASMIMRTT